MRTLGTAIARWLVGIVLGLVAAGFLFGLVARATSTATSTAADGPLAILALGFGLAFFPAVLAAGTRRPIRVVLRALVAFAVEGLAALVLGAYQVVTGSALIPLSALGWVGSASESLASFAALFSSALVVTVVGLVVLVICAFLMLALREATPAGPAAPPAQTAPSQTVKGSAIAVRPTVSQPTAATKPALKPAEPAISPPSDDEDAKLMADLENLRKRLPTMGVDEPGSSGKR